MAENTYLEAKTEPPSPRRRERAREEGRVAFSRELNSGIILFAGVAGLSWLAGSLGSNLLKQTRIDLALLPFTNLSTSDLQVICAGKFGQAVSIAGGWIGLIFIIALVANYAQAGWNLN